MRTLHARGLVCLLASNTARPMTIRRRTLEDSGLGFMIPVCSSAIGTAKPFPAFYQHIIDQADVAPERVLFVGDNLLNDVTAPINAGMRAAWVNRKLSGQAQPAPLCDGTMQLAHLSQLPLAISSLLAS
ncbi:HAD family hydrolase [Streptomyces bluensis]|uniref:HAD family hydrolase n=1 Tax=Streptomyces bluensis TaxID=33897 RepID=UPI00332A4F17